MAVRSKRFVLCPVGSGDPLWEIALSGATGSVASAQADTGHRIRPDMATLLIECRLPCL